MTQQGRVAFLNSTSPAARAGVWAGDRVLSIDGASQAQTYPLYSGKRAGDQLVVVFERAGRSATAVITLAPPALPVHVSRLIPLLVSLVFWSIGLVAWVLRPFHHTSRLFFFLSHTAAGMLTFGALSAIRWPWSSALFSVFLILLMALALHFYASFPNPLPRCARHPLLLAVYTGAGLLIVLSIGPLLLRDAGPNPTALWIARRSFVVFILVAVLVLLFRRQADVPLLVLRRRRLLIAGTVAGLLPLLVLSIVPELIWSMPLVDYAWTFPFLALLPLAYGYVIDQGELGRIDRLLNRSLVYVLLTTTLLGLYILLFYVLDHIVPLFSWSRVVISGGLVVMIALLFNPLRIRIQQRIDHFFYGGWYNYRMVVLSGSAALGQARNLEQLVRRLMLVAQTMRFQSAALLWHEDQMLVPKGSFGYSPEVLRLLHLPTRSMIVHYLGAAGRLISWEQISRLLMSRDLMEAECVLLAAQHVRLWLPLVNGGTVLGVFVMGEREGEVFLDREDWDILLTLSAQASVTAVNVALLESLRVRLAEMERVQDDLAESQKRLADSREAERLHLAQELHDGPVQELYGVLFELGTLSKMPCSAALQPRMVALQGMTQQVIHALRSICGELRPPALAPFGLEVAIRSHVQLLQENHPELDIQVDLIHDGIALPERVRLVLFRIYQEATNNILQHAEASSVFICLRLNMQQIVLEVRDDGCGFVVPEHWITFARQGHLGLLGIAERAETIGGRAEVISAPGEGTTIRVVVCRSGTSSAKQTITQLLE